MDRKPITCMSVAEQEHLLNGMYDALNRKPPKCGASEAYMRGYRRAQADTAGKAA